jgi:hypothetical protein
MVSSPQKPQHQLIHEKLSVCLYFVTGNNSSSCMVSGSRCESACFWIGWLAVDVIPLSDTEAGNWFAATFQILLRNSFQTPAAAAAKLT